MFKKGDKVLCISIESHWTAMKTNEIYTVLEVVEKPGGQSVILLERGPERWYYVWRFIHNTSEAKVKYMQKLMEERNGEQPVV